MSITLQSSAFGTHEAIPRQYTADGSNISPPLKWSNIPAGTKEVAIVCEDPDAPQAEPFVHWVMYKIPPTAMSVKERVGTQGRLKVPPGAMQGKNSFGDIGYEGPQPPDHKTHHYQFKIFALDAHVPPQPAMDEKTLLNSIQGHILDQGELVGLYQH